MCFRESWSRVAARVEAARKGGHGKITPRETAGQFLCSPRTWGWSAAAPVHHWTGALLPTHVGMVRGSCASAAWTNTAPHARGDGPPDAKSLPTVVSCSPRTWGWSARPGPPATPRRLLPTHVGMVRSTRPTRYSPPAAPHARGDGPGRAGFAEALQICSPRTWGWSGSPRPGARFARLLPTHVGMVRCGPIRIRPPRPAPHARGDGPGWAHRWRTPARCSPRTWGWSNFVIPIGELHRLLPTHVGMVLAI